MIYGDDRPDGEDARDQTEIGTGRGDDRAEITARLTLRPDAGRRRPNRPVGREVPGWSQPDLAHANPARAERRTWGAPRGHIATP